MGWGVRVTGAGSVPGNMAVSLLPVENYLEMLSVCLKVTPAYPLSSHSSVPRVSKLCQSFHFFYPSSGKVGLTTRPLTGASGATFHWTQMSIAAKWAPYVTANCRRKCLAWVWKCLGCEEDICVVNSVDMRNVNAKLPVPASGFSCYTLASSRWTPNIQEWTLCNPYPNKFST